MVTSWKRARSRNVIALEEAKKSKENEAANEQEKDNSR